jgi:hypothetical protein
VNTLHVHTTQNDPSPGALSDEINTKMQAAYRNLLPTTYTFDSIDVQTVVNPNNPSEVPAAGSHALGIAGARTVADEDLPPRIGGLLSWKTDSIGRYARGRFYGPPLEKKAAISGDLIAAGDDYSTAMNAFGAMVTDANLSGGSSWSSLWLTTWQGKFVVYSPTRHKLNTSPYWFDIKSYAYTRRLAYLSSRDS